MKRWLLFPVFLLSITVVMLFISKEINAAPKKAKFVGFKRCGGCHIDEKDSWVDSSHAKAFDLLKAGTRVDAKKKAGLDPDKSYTDDKDCLPCHVTGYKERGGYKKGMKKKDEPYVKGVTCETCHGKGSLYRKNHKEAGNRFKKEKKSTLRKVLVKAGQNFDYEEACAVCHLNYEGSSWDKAKKPFTPFTPKVDKKYIFDFEKRVRKVPEGLHEHYKLKGIFEGPPIPKIREEFQKTAKELKPPEEGEE